MKMKTSDAMCDWIRDRIKQQQEYAGYAARSYTDTDDPKHKASYNQHVAVANQLEEVWTMLCQGLHALEAKIPGPGDKVEAKE